MLQIGIIIFTYILSLSVSASEKNTTEALNCQSDAGLVAQGFTVGTKQTSEAAQRIKEFVSKNDPQIVPLKGGTIYSRVAGRMIVVIPYDDLLTPNKEMLGDYVLINDFKTGETIEVRWYEAGVKTALYNPSLTPCATDMVPWPYNSLY